MPFTRTVAARTSEGSTTKDTDDGGRPSRGDIALLAYRFFEERGRREGHDVEDWLSAERELTRPFGGVA